MSTLLATEANPTPTASRGAVNFIVAGVESPADAGTARVRELVAPPARGRFLVVLSASAGFRAALKRDLPRPLGRNRVLMDAAPKAGKRGETDFEQLARRAWFYRRLGATHLLVECEPGKADLREYLTRLLAAFVPLASDDGLVIDLVVPAKAEASLKNRWLVDFLLDKAAEVAGRELNGKVVRVRGKQSGPLALEGSAEEEPAQPRLPEVAAYARRVENEGQLGLL